MFMILGADFHMIKENCNASPKKESNSLHSRVLSLFFFVFKNACTSF